MAEERQATEFMTTSDRLQERRVYGANEWVNGIDCFRCSEEGPETLLLVLTNGSGHLASCL